MYWGAHDYIASLYIRRAQSVPLRLICFALQGQEMLGRKRVGMAALGEGVGSGRVSTYPFKFKEPGQGVPNAYVDVNYLRGRRSRSPMTPEASAQWSQQ